MTRRAFLLRWLRPCRHRTVRGVANFYDRDSQSFVHLIECRDCGLVQMYREEP